MGGGFSSLLLLLFFLKKRRWIIFLKSQVITSSSFTSMANGVTMIRFKTTRLHLGRRIIGYSSAGKTAIPQTLYPLATYPTLLLLLLLPHWLEVVPVATTLNTMRRLPPSPRE